MLRQALHEMVNKLVNLRLLTSGLFYFTFVSRNKHMAKIGINLATGSLQQKEIIVGIDLGTTNSLVAIIHPDTKIPVVLKEHDSNALVPSVIHFNESGIVTIGDDALNFLITHPGQTIFSAKRLMGKSYNDIDKPSELTYKIIDDEKDTHVKIQVGDTFYTPVDLSSFILKELKKRAEHILKTPVNKAVITVPAYFNDAQRQATRDAGKLAGLDVLRIINEPTAASLAYGIGLRKEDEKIIAVYDLGGGTFDISILRITGGIFDVLSTNGNTAFGGDDLDKAIVEHWKNEFPFLIRSKEDTSHLQKLRLTAEAAKKHLSAHEIFSAEIEGGEITLTKDKLFEIVLPLLNPTIQNCRNALKDALLTINDIDEVIMVGGSTRMPVVKTIVSEFFQKKINDSLNPDEVVALGAAVQADILAGNNKDYLLLDITPLSLGIETSGGLMEVLIPRNAKLPQKASKQYTTQVDGQPGMRISVYQGERDMVKDNRKLAEFILNGIPGMPAGFPKVEISFLINADGILNVSAKELRSGVEQSIEVKPQVGITDSEVEQMLMDSITHAKDDVASRALAEAKAEGEQLLVTTEKFLQKHSASINREELMNTADAMQSLQLALTMDDKNLLHSKIEALNEVSRPYAERVMDEAIAGAMKGKVI